MRTQRTRALGGLVAAVLALATTSPSRAGDADRGDGRHRYAQPAAVAAGDARILFTRNGALFAMDAEGGDVRRVLRRSATCHAASWSPDGSQIAFVGDPDPRDGLEGHALYVVGADGTGLRELVPIRSRFPTRPAWSPAPAADGTYCIVYDDAVRDAEDDHDLFVVRPDGTGRRNLTESPDVSESYPTWSPDAGRLAFVAEHPREVNPRGKHRIRRRRKSDGPTIRTVKDVMVAELTAQADGLALGPRENVTDVASGKLAFHEASGESHRFSYLEWSRTRDELAVVVSCAPEREQSDVWVIDVRRPAAARNVTRTADASESCVTWSPDDTHLAFVREPQSGAAVLCFARADGKGKPELLGGTADHRPMDWARNRPAAVATASAADSDAHSRPPLRDRDVEATPLSPPTQR